MRNPNLLCQPYAQVLEEAEKQREELLAEKESRKDDWYWQSSLAQVEGVIERLKQDIAQGLENPYYLDLMKEKAKEAKN